MASPVGERDGQVKRPRWVSLIFLPAAALALTAMLVAGCGGGGDPSTKVVAGDLHAKVEAGLRHYFSTFSPEDSIFPYGAGPPRVKDNGCKDLHRQFPLLLLLGSSKFPLLLPPGEKFPLPPPGSTKFKKVALWRCFVGFNSFTLTVHVAVNDRTEVVWAWPVYPDSRETPNPGPARTYTG